MNCGGVLKSTEPGASAGAGLTGRGESGCEEALEAKERAHLKGTFDNIQDKKNY